MRFLSMLFRRLSWGGASLLWCVSLSAGLSACSGTGRTGGAPIADVGVVRPAVAETAPEWPAKSPTVGEVALAQGIRSYQAAQYPQAEAQLKAALKEGLSQPTDLSSAHKYLAFIYCTTTREGLCLAAFKSAQLADPAFALSKSEAGHPMWDKAYKKALGLK